MTINKEYDIQKATNLSELVREYEIENVKKSYAVKYDRTQRLNSLEYEGLVKLQDYVLEQDDEIYTIAREMEKHYKKLFHEMVNRYQVLDAEKQLFENHLQYSVAPKSRVKQITSKHQLREIVYAHNAQYRK